VATASRDTLARSLLNSSQATMSLCVQRRGSLSNTFLNFAEAAPTVLRRAVSFDVGCLSDSTVDEGSPRVSAASASTGATTPSSSFLEVPARMPLQAATQSPRWCDLMETKGDESDDFESFGAGSTYIDSAAPSEDCSRRNSFNSTSSWSSAPCCSSQDPFAMAILSRVQEMHPTSSFSSQAELRAEKEHNASRTLTPKQLAAHHVEQQEQEEEHQKAEAVVESDGITTVMLQNLPRIFIKQDLLDALDANGFWNEYDYVHIAYNFASGVCYGYAFINFTTVEAAAAFTDAWNGSTCFRQRKHKKPLVVMAAALQGLPALLAQASMKKLLKVKNPGFRPFIRGGAEM